ncbi:class I SAM-dependent methyltransferase [Pseudorhodobacter ferrugineus]|uniref:class I SAM-dependent methyltransferase n=2 Tax=Pseudorhodobacter ferrugineus TaxID=77008 RepID=UPI00067DA479|nr:class I SAM-dependent methyltransferase [Pseudorhodobacter ferrugineus]
MKAGDLGIGTGIAGMGQGNMIDLRTWPQGDSVVLGLLDEIGAQQAPKGPVVLVEAETFPAAVIARFDTAVKAGRAKDTPDGFATFASRDFSNLAAFRHANQAVTRPAMTIDLADLRVDPAAVLPQLLRLLAPSDAALADAPDTAKRLRIWQAANPPPDLLRFRYYDATMFKHLAALTLERDDVEAVFQDLLGRSPSVKGALALQTQPSLGNLRAALMASEEYVKLHRPAHTTGAEQTTTDHNGFAGFAAAFDRPETALAVTPPENRAAARAKAEAATAPVIAAQQSYQPFYGLSDPKHSTREALLRASCDLLVQEFAHVQRKSQIRILDVGCNAGFASFVLAETFPNTIGFDVNAVNIALCHALKAHSGSAAMFFKADLLKIAETSAKDFEALDAVLFLNVIHQLIFAKGIPYVKAMLATLSRHVDLIVVELSRPAEYVPFGKDHLLPLDPAEILEDCRDATLTLIKDGKRPVYTIRRRALEVDGLRVPYSKVNYSLHDKARVNRKYYFGSDSFTKVIRYTALQSRDKLQTELHGLRALTGQNIAPAIRSWDDDGVTAGRVVMERLYGPMLSEVLGSLTAAC